MDTKICNACQETHLFSAFYADKRTNDGYSTVCRLCKSAAMREARRNQLDFAERARILRSQTFNPCWLWGRDVSSD